MIRVTSIEAWRFVLLPNVLCGFMFEPYAKYI